MAARAAADRYAVPKTNGAAQAEDLTLDFSSVCDLDEPLRENQRVVAASGGLTQQKHRSGLSLGKVLEVSATKAKPAVATGPQEAFQEVAAPLELLPKALRQGADEQNEPVPVVFEGEGLAQVRCTHRSSFGW